MSLLLSLISRSPIVQQALLGIAALLLVSTIGLGIRCKVLVADRDAALAEKAQLSAQVKLQNAAVAAWQQESLAQKGRADQAAEKAQKVLVRTETRVERIAAEPVPDACTDAVKWGAQAAIESGQDWEEGKEVWEKPL